MEQKGCLKLSVTSKDSTLFSVNKAESQFPKQEFGSDMM